MKHLGRTMTIGALAVTTLFLLSTFSGIAGDWANTTVDLYAGQYSDVGSVNVYDDGDDLVVTFTTIEGWYITETHLDIQTTPAAFPMTKTNNPKVGQFAYSGEHEYETEVVYTIEDTWDGSTLYVAAHAVVVKAELLEAPWYGATVYSYTQGLRKDGSPVEAARSDPAQALELDSTHTAYDFFSLGFGGEIVLKWDCPIVNGDGVDVKVWEDTWGTGYPSETANVFASQDGSNWYLLGVADNSDHGNYWQTRTDFDLEDVGLDWATYIKVVDTSNPAIHASNGDGFDLNAIAVLHDCYDVEQMETAWGFTDANGAGFGGSNWAQYFTVSSS